MRKNNRKTTTPRQKRLGSNSRLMDHIDEIQTWVSNSKDTHASSSKQNVVGATKKKVVNSKKITFSDDANRKIEMLDREILEWYESIPVFADDGKKLYSIRIKKDAMDTISLLVKENTKLSFNKYSSIVRKYMSEHIPVLFSLSKSEIIELLEYCGEEFDNLELVPTQHDECKKFTLRYPVHNQIQKLNDSFSLNMTLQNLSRKLFRYYAYRVYKILKINK